MISILIPALQISLPLQEKEWPWAKKCDDIEARSDLTYTRSQIWTYLQLLRSHQGHHTLGLTVNDLCFVRNLCISRKYDFCSLKIKSKNSNSLRERPEPNTNRDENKILSLFWNYVKETAFIYRKLIFNITLLAMIFLTINYQIPCAIMKNTKKLSSRLKTWAQNYLS